MAKKYEKIRKFVETNPGIHPTVRKWAEAVNGQITWPTTTTTTSTTTTTTT